MHPHIFDEIEDVLYPCSFVGEKHGLWGGITENICFGVTVGKDRCGRSLPNSRKRHDEIGRSLSELIRLAKVREEGEGEGGRNPASLTKAFFANLRNVIHLQHCYLHSAQPKKAVLAWQKRNYAAHHDEGHEQGQDASSITSSPAVSSMFDSPPPGPRPPSSPDTAPQTRESKHTITSISSTQGAQGGPTKPSLPVTPTRAPRQRSASGARLQSSSGSTTSGRAPGTKLDFGKKKKQKQQNRPVPVEPLAREPTVALSVSEVDDPYVDATTTIANESEKLETKDEDIQTDSPRPGGTIAPAQPTDIVSYDTSWGYKHYYKKDCYADTDYAHIIDTMQTGYAHHTARSVGRLYVVRDKRRSGLFKIGWTDEKDMEKRWDNTPCIKSAEKVFVSDSSFAGAFKAESLVIASLRHRQNTLRCTSCKGSVVHREWFWVEQDVILAWVDAWTAYVKSEIYSEGYPTDAYGVFADRLLRITPARIHAQLKAIPSLSTSASTGLEPEAESETGGAVTNPATTHSPSAIARARVGDNGSGGNGADKTPPQPKPTIVRTTTATSIQQFVRRAVTLDSWNGLNKRIEKEDKESTVVVRELGDMSGRDGGDGDGGGDGHRRNNSGPQQKAAKMASQVASQIQSTISGIAKRGRTAVEADLIPA